MKTRKLISLFTAIVVMISMFSSVVAFASPTAQSSNPEFTATIAKVANGKAQIKILLKNNETLSYEEVLDADFGEFVEGYNANLINAMSVSLTLDDEVFNLSDPAAVKASVSKDALSVDIGQANVVSANDAITGEITYAFGPSTVPTYMRSVPAHILQIVVPLNEGYTSGDNIPATAITFGECIVEYSAYDGGMSPSTYTIYGTENTITKDYILAVGCDDTFVHENPTVAVSSLTLDAETKSINTGDTFDLTATINADATDKTVAFAVTDAQDGTTSGATVSATSVTAGDDGKATVTVRSATAGTYKVTATAGEISKTCTVTVSDSTPPVIPDEFDGVITHDDYDAIPEDEMIVVETQNREDVSASAKVTVSYKDGTTKTFGTTLGDYLQISGATIDLKIRFAVKCSKTFDANGFTFSLTTDN